MTETDSLDSNEACIEISMRHSWICPRYASSVDMSLQGYVDADWARSAVDRKSTSGCCFTLGSAMVSWCSRKQSSVALSTAKAEYIALSVAVREVVWLRKLLTDLFAHEMDYTIIHCDN